MTRSVNGRRKKEGRPLPRGGTGQTDRSLSRQVFLPVGGKPHGRSAKFAAAAASGFGPEGRPLLRRRREKGKLIMSNRLFQGVIHQMKDAIDRTVGVVDEGMSIIACSDLSRIGEILPALTADSFTSLQTFVLDNCTFKPFP